MRDAHHVVDREWLQIGDACRILGISRSTLLAAEEAGLIVAGRTPGGHRRFAPDELERYLRSHGASDPSPRMPEATARGVRRQPARLVTDLRTVLRELVQLIDGACAGIYLLDGDRLGYCSGFGIPRWQADRLRSGPTPEPVVAALRGSRPRMVDAGDLVSRPRGGQASVQALRLDAEVLGVLFVVSRTGHEMLPAELRIVAAAQRVLALLVDRLRRLVDLELRLDRVHELTAQPDP